MNLQLVKHILRIGAGILFLFIGLIHFYDVNLMAVFVPLPFGSKIFVIITGVVISLASMGLILNKYVRTCLSVIAITLAVTALFVQIPVSFKDPDELLKMVSLSNLTKLTLASIVLIVLSRRTK